MQFCREMLLLRHGLKMTMLDVARWSGGSRKIRLCI
jgi:hypothetical protein